MGLMSSRVLLSFFAWVVAASAAVTYHDVAPIIQSKCQQCHRPNDIAPFSLMTFDDAQTWATDMRKAVSEGVMPPWKPAPGVGAFRGAYGLSADEKQMLLDWIDQGAQQGDPLENSAETPAATPSTWRLGEPDLVLKMPQFTPPRAPDTYRCFVLPTGLSENQFVNGYQILPGDKQQVHHVLLYIDTTGEADRLDGKDGQPGYTCFGGPLVTLSIGGLLGGWAPGAQPTRLQDGIAVLLPAKARIVMQVHYHPGGKVAPDQTSFGLYYAPRDVVQQRLVNIPIVNTTFTIPPGANAYEVKASFPILPFLTGKAILVAPHMHLLGKQIRLDLQLRDGTRQPLILIDNWDFNWQGFYTFQEPVTLPSGASVQLSAIYDNSENNPRNPNSPLKAVRWGEGTEDEMCLGFLGVVFDNESLLPLRPEKR
jgi:hypothetical protein